jgi:hypothetical protein
MRERMRERKKEKKKKYVWNKSSFEDDSLKVSPSMIQWNVGPLEAAAGTPVAQDVRL